MSAPELSLIHAGRGEPQPAVPVPHLLRRLFTNRDVVLLTLAYISQGYVFYIFFNWFFLYLVDVRGFGILAGGFLTSLPWLVGSIAAPIGGQVCDRLCQSIGPRWGCRLPSLICMPIMAAFLLAGAMAVDPYWAVAFLTISFSFNLFSDGAYWAGMTFVAGRHTAAACGIMNTGSNLGGVVSAPLIPIIAAWLGWEAALGSGAIVALLGATLWFWIRVDHPLETTT
jgi:ACS family glucarate transporter-like MFS transporter